MAIPPSGPAPGAFAITKPKIIIAVSLLLTWLFANFLNTNKPVILSHISSGISSAVQALPAIEVDWFPEEYDPRSQFNSSKVALLIEGRPLPHLVPHLLQMIATAPYDWRFVFIGSNKSVASASRSFSTQYHQVNGKLDLMVLPKPWTIDSKEDVFRLMTDTRFYDEFLPGVEWILKFESDSVLCSRSTESINDWLEYDWAGAPRHEHDHFAGNGGLSLRRVSMIKKILGFQSRYNNTEPEDEWFGKRITVLPGAVTASGEQEDHFSMELVYHENPMGIHVPNGGQHLQDEVWKEPKRRSDIFTYCPEVVMIMPMKLEVERCEGDNRQGDIIEPPGGAKTEGEEKAGKMLKSIFGKLAEGSTKRVPERKGRGGEG